MSLWAKFSRTCSKLKFLRVLSLSMCVCVAIWVSVVAVIPFPSTRVGATSLAFSSFGNCGHWFLSVSWVAYCSQWSCHRSDSSDKYATGVLQNLLPLWHRIKVIFFLFYITVVVFAVASLLSTSDFVKIWWFSSLLWLWVKAVLQTVELFPAPRHRLLLNPLLPSLEGSEGYCFHFPPPAR